MNNTNNNNILELFERINTFVFDVDGVFTNNELLLSEKGDLLRTMNARDGYAVVKALQQNYKVAIITGGRSKSVVQRFQDLGVTDIYIGANSKIEPFLDLMSRYEIDARYEVLYMGDDMPDLAVLNEVGLSACPADAIPEVLQVAKYISPFKGGYGCVRDVIEKTLKLNNHWH